MFQAIVHAPVLRPGARLCVSDLRQGPVTAALDPVAGDAVNLRFGTCCPDLDAGAFTMVGPEVATLRVAGVPWRLTRCLHGGGIDVPGLVAQDWFVTERLAAAA